MAQLGGYIARAVGIACLVMCLAPLSSSGQDAAASCDSLARVVQLAAPDTSRARLWLQYAKCQYQANNALRAVAGYHKAQELFQRLADTLGQANALAGLAQVYFHQGEYPVALKHFSRALALNRALANRKQEGVLLLKIANVYFEQGIPDSALAYYERSLIIRKELNDTKGQAGCLLGIGNVHSQAYRNQQSLDFFNQALALYQQVADTEGQAKCLNNIGQTLTQMNQYEQALSYFGQALAIHEASGDKRAQTYPLDNMAFVLMKMGKLSVARGYARRALALAQQVNSLDRAFVAAGTNAQIDSCLGDWRSAYRHQVLFAAYHGQVFNEDKAIELGRVQTQFQLELQQERERQEAARTAELAALATHRRNTLQYSAAGVFILLLFAVGSLSARRKLLGRYASVLVFMATLLAFEFILLFLDPWLDAFNAGPAIRLGTNASLALVIAPLHIRLAGYFRRKLNHPGKSSARH